MDVRLPDFPFAISLYVWYRDLDAMGHVNNSVYLSYFEQARTRYWLSLMAGGGHATPANPMIAAVGHPSEHDFRKLGFVVVHAECDYVAPAKMGESLLVGCKVSEIRNSSFVFDYKIVTGEKTGSDADSHLVAKGRTIQALYDWATETTMPFTDELKKKIEAREGHAVKIVSK
jgi:acyl-CoA thioester hydrolase